MLEELECSAVTSDMSPSSVYQRTEQFVVDQNQHRHNMGIFPGAANSKSNFRPHTELASSRHTDSATSEQYQTQDRHHSRAHEHPVSFLPEETNSVARSVPSLSGRHGNQHEMDISKFLIKKELVTNRLLKFSEKPESYLSWENTFKDVMAEIDASPAEELDLMVKWFGPDSARQVSSIKTSNAGDSFRGLDRAWTRLDGYYGSPERIEDALKQKLRNLPKMTYKDKTKIYEPKVKF